MRGVTGSGRLTTPFTLCIQTSQLEYFVFCVFVCARVDTLGLCYSYVCYIGIKFPLLNRRLEVLTFIDVLLFMKTYISALHVPYSQSGPYYTFLSQYGILFLTNCHVYLIFF